MIAWTKKNKMSLTSPLIERKAYKLIKMTPMLVLLVLSISSCFGYTHFSYNEDSSNRWCYVKWQYIGEDNLNSSVLLEEISGSSLLSCYMSCDVTEDCGAAAFRQPDECLLIKETAKTLNKTTNRNSPTDLMITEVSE